jgi:NADH:ubiquinone reductase (H+-translocating)
LKTIEQATEIRRRVLLAFERAEAEIDPEKQRQWLTFIVVGGGPTGVELAGALGEITRYTLTRDFRRIDPSIARVILIEAGPRVLAAFDESLSKSAKQDLENLGVHVWLGSRVSEVNADGVRLGSEWVAAKTAIWAAGVKPSALNTKLGCELDKGGRAIVTKALHLPGRPEVYVIGDQAHTPGDDGQPLPGLAPVAMQQGRFVGQEIARAVKTGAYRAAEFRYNDKGIMATIGRRKAVVQSKGIRMHGLIAWWMWLVIHIYYLIGFRNRFFVLWQWAYSYLTYRRGARLITERDWHLH